MLNRSPNSAPHDMATGFALLFPLKVDERMKDRRKKNAPYFTEYLDSAVIGPCKDSAASEPEPRSSVPFSEQNIPSGYVLAKNDLASRLTPHMRMLRRVLQVLPRSFTICEGYRVTCHIEELECGHTVVTYKPNYGAKRRNCKSCVNEEQERQKAVNE